MNAQIREEAAEWLVDFQTDQPGPQARERFAQWLRTSPEHVRAYLELVAFWEDVSHYDANHQVDVDSLISLAHAESPNVVPLDTRSGVPPLVRSPLLRAARTLVDGRLIAAAALCALTAGGWLVLHRDSSYTTDIGEQRTVTLADGSVAELNAASRIRVRFSDRERALELLQGQALFRVVRNPVRPFVVISGTTRIRDVGTEFDVNRKPTGTVVTVLEGRVDVLPGADSLRQAGAASAVATPLEVVAGEQVTLDLATPAGAPVQKHRANVATATAWTQQQLVFESAPLTEVAEQFNRFNTRKILVPAGTAADFHMSGTFPALDPASLPRLVKFLRHQPGIEVVESDIQIVVTQK